MGEGRRSLTKSIHQRALDLPCLKSHHFPESSIPLCRQPEQPFFFSVFADSYGDSLNINDYFSHSAEENLIKPLVGLLPKNGSCTRLTMKIRSFSCREHQKFLFTN